MVGLYGGERTGFGHHYNPTTSKQHFSVLRTPTGSLCTQTKHDGRRKRKIGQHCDAFGPLFPLLQVPIEPFFAAFAKFQEVNISFVRLSVCMEQLGSHWRSSHQMVIFDLNEVIPLCINSIYLLYYIIPSTQHKSLSLPLHVST